MQPVFLREANIEVAGVKLNGRKISVKFMCRQKNARLNHNHPSHSGFSNLTFSNIFHQQNFVCITCVSLPN
jgi:hypothetical protein